MTKKLSKLFLIITALTFTVSMSGNAQTKSADKTDEVIYTIKIEDMTSDYKLQKIINLLDTYKDRIVKYETVLANKEIKITIKENENILNLLEVFTTHGYTAYYNDNENNRVVNTGKGFTEKFAEQK